MAKKKPRPVPRIEVTRNRKKEFNYKLIGKNSQVLIHCNQGFKRIDRLKSNVTAVVKIFNKEAIDVQVVKTRLEEFPLKVSWKTEDKEKISYFNLPVFVQVN